MTRDRDNLLVTTTEQVPGYNYKVIGETFGVVTITKGMLGNWMAGMRGIFGGKVGTYTKLQVKARSKAMEQLKQNAEQMGANGIVMMRYDSNAIAADMLSITAYGTAVVFVD